MSEPDGKPRIHRPAGRFLWRPRNLPPTAVESADLRDMLDQAERVREARTKADEPERVDSKAVLDSYGRDAEYYRSLQHMSWVENMRAVRRALTTDDRLRDAQRRAKAQHIDISHELHVLNAMLDRARRGGRSEPPSMLRRLERLEARLDHAPDLPNAA